jgi:DNA-binding CsgD family transcriptional regulator
VAEIVGREREQRELLDALADVQFASKTFWVSGEPGIGKTSLLQWIARVAGTVRVLHARGHEVDSTRGYAMLYQLVKPLLVRGAPAEDPSGVLRDIRPGSATSVNEAAIEYALLELIGEASQGSPILVLADDLHWFDLPSCAALAFLSRRLESERVMLVVASRRAPVESEWGPLRHVPLKGLDARSARLVAERAGHQFDPSSYEAAGGNPLALATLGAGTVGAVQVPERIAAEYGRILAQLPEATVRALTLTAAAGLTADPEHVAAAMRSFGVAASDLHPARAAGLLDDHDVVGHPLIRRVLLDDGATACLAHDALADATAGSDELGGMLHRLSGSRAVDAATIASANELASTAADRGRFVEASELFARIAARAAASGDGRSASEAWRQGGMSLGFAARWADSLTQLDCALEAAPDRYQRVRVQRSRVWVSMWLGGSVRASALELADELNLLTDDEIGDDPERRADVARAWGSLLALYATCDVYGAVASARRAPVHPILEGDRAWVAVLSLERDVAPFLPAELGLEEGATRYYDNVDGIRVEMAMLVGDWHKAARLADDNVRHTRSLHLIAELGPAVCRQSLALTFTGDVALAYGNALIAIDLLPNDGSLLGGGAYSAALVGSSHATEWATLCGEIGRRHGVTAFVIDSEHRLGLVALANDDLASATAHLLECWRLMTDHGYLHPAFALARGDIAEVLARSGDTVGLRRVLAELCNEPFASDWSRGVAARARGIAGDTDQFNVALDLLASSPWEAARTRLTWACASTGADRVRLAQLAADEFARIGAVAWATQATLLIGDERCVVATCDPFAALSDRERAVATTVARGLSNKEVAAELYISLRTVDAHLQQIYRKLDIRSRTQLAALLLAGSSAR